MKRSCLVAAELDDRHALGLNGIQSIPAGESMTVGIIGEMRLAKRHPVAALIGFGMGGYVPVESFTLMHGAGALSVWQRGLVVACLLYSSLSVWQWARIALASPWKAAAFVVLLEGGMVVSGVPFLSWVALIYLICINATHTAAIVAARDLELSENTKALEARVIQAEAQLKTARATNERMRDEAQRETAAVISDAHARESEAQEERDRALERALRAEGACDELHQRVQSELAQLQTLEAAMRLDFEARVMNLERRPRASLPRSSAGGQITPALSEAELYDRARQHVVTSRRCSVEGLKKHLKLGHPKAARLVERLEQDGIVGPANEAGLRSVLVEAA